MGLGKTLCVISLVHTVLRSPIVQDASRIEDLDEGAEAASAAEERGGEGNPPPECTGLARRSGRLRTVLIIAPKNVTFNWQTEMRKWSGTTTGRRKSINAVPVSVLDSDTSKNIGARAEILVEWFNKAQDGYGGGGSSAPHHGYDEDDDFIDSRTTDEDDRTDAESESEFESDSDAPARKKLRKTIANARKRYGNVLVMGYDMYRNLVKLVPEAPVAVSSSAAAPYDNALVGRDSAEDAQKELRERFSESSVTRDEYFHRVKQSGKVKNAAAFFLQYVTLDMKKRYGSAKPPRRQAGNRPDKYYFWSPKESRWFDSMEEAARRWTMVSAKMGGKRIQHNNNHDRTHIKEWEEKRKVCVEDADEESANHIRIQAIVRHTLISPGPDMLVCDEGHMLRKHSSARSLALRRCDSLRRLILTGTPMQNNLEEYHCMVDMVRPAHLGNLKEFQVRASAPVLSVCAAARRHALPRPRPRPHNMYRASHNMNRDSHNIYRVSLAEPICEPDQGRADEGRVAVPAAQDEAALARAPHEAHRLRPAPLVGYPPHRAWAEKVSLFYLPLHFVRILLTI